MPQAPFWFRSLLLSSLILLCCGTKSWADFDIPGPDLLARHTNEKGLTLDILLDENTLTLAHHPLSPETLNSVSENVHRAPRRGLQFELLTPGDFGATIHYRW